MPACEIDIDITAWDGAKGQVKLLWDENFVYVLVEVTDPVLNMSSANDYEQDSVELYLDQGNDKKPFYDENDGQYRINYKGNVSFGNIPKVEGFESAAKETKDGYLIEVALPLLEEAKEGDIMGLEAQINDSNASGVRQAITKFNDPTDSSWETTELWGELVLE